MKAIIKAMKGISVLAVVFVATLTVSPSLKSKVFPPVNDSDLIVQAFQARQSNVLVEAEAKVVWVYQDLEDKSKYQNFTVRLTNGHRVRVRHSLDEARRAPVQKNDTIRLRGEYDWASDGGLIHWTHDDPAGRREGGWIEVDGKRFF